MSPTWFCIWMLASSSISSPFSSCPAMDSARVFASHDITRNRLFFTNMAQPSAHV